MFSHQQTQSPNPNKPPLNNPTKSIVLDIGKNPDSTDLPNGEPGTPQKPGGSKRMHENSGDTPDSKKFKPQSEDEGKFNPITFPDLGDEGETATNATDGAAAAAAAEMSDSTSDEEPPVVDEMAILGAEPGAPLELVKEIVDPNTIPPGTPRSGGVVKSFRTHRYYDENGKSDRGLQWFWQAKHTKFVKLGYTYLIGEVATYIDRHFKKDSSDYERVYTRTSIKKFKKCGDIQTYDGSYEKIISLMHKYNECTLATAEALLKSLSLPQMNGTVKSAEPKELKIDHGRALFSELFDENGNPKNAQKLMGALICEAIRFQEDGALARMAIRGVIRLFQKTLKSDRIEDNPFYQVFVDGENPVVFAKEGGKQKTLDLFFKPSMNQSFLQLSAFMHETSDVDEDGSQATTAIALSESPKSKSGRHLRYNAQFTFPDGPQRRTIKSSAGQTSEQDDPDETELLTFGQRNLKKEFSAEETEAEVKEEDKDSTPPDQDE